MSKKLIIAEKPSVARLIAKALGCTSSRKGYIEGTHDIITWAIGHLVTLFQPEDYDSELKKWSPDTLPIIPEKFKLKIVNSTKSQFNVISKLINSPEVESLICATDAGREGELIFRFIYAKTGCNKPFKRMWLSSVTDSAIKKAIFNLKGGYEYDNLYHSALARAYADWLLGINLTRAFSLALKGKYNAGRVLTPTLNILVERELIIQNFKSQTYYKIVGNFESQTDNLNAVYVNPKLSMKSLPVEFIERKKDADKALAKILAKQQEPWEVERVEKQTIEEPPPLLYDLTELQRECNALYGFTAEQTLRIVQELYEDKKAVTYPRTDSRYLTSDLGDETKQILRRISSIKGYQCYTESLPDGTSINAILIDDAEVSDHHAIIPTGEIPTSLTPDSFKVYDLIVKRFIAGFMDDYVYNTASATIKHKEVDGKFIVSWTDVLQLGWGAVYNQSKESSNVELAEGESLKLVGAKIKDVITKPTQRYSDGTLLKAMGNAGRFVTEKDLKEGLGKGLGTPATRAETIEKLIKVEYIRRDGKQLIPCEKGMQLIAKLHKMPEITSPRLTAQWELKLQSIDKGEASFEQFMRDIKGYTKEQVKKALKLR